MENNTEEKRIKFIQDIAKSKIPYATYHKTFVEVFGHFRDADIKIDKTQGTHLTKIYQYFEKECPALQTISGKGKKEVLRKYLQDLFNNTKTDIEISDRPQPPTNPQSIPTPEPSPDLTTLEFIGRNRDLPLIFSGGETFVQDIIDQVNNSLEIGSRLRVVCSPRYSEPLFLPEGKLPLSENDKIREQDIIKKFDINYTNDACAAVVTRPNWSDSPLTIRYCTCKYAEILSLRNSIPYVGIITANVLLFCEELRCIVVHRRSKKSRDYPSTLHTFGGAFIPPGAGHQSPHQEDRLGIQHTGVREIFEESKAAIDISESVPIIVTDEFEIQSIEITYLGVSVTARQVRRMLGNWEGDPVQIGFDELEEKLANINEWVPSGWVHILLWLSCNTPSANSPIKFGGLSGSELASATVKRCLTKPSKMPQNKLLM
jgi:hypothetical protein